MAQNKTPRNTVTTSTTRSGGATTTTLRPAGTQTPAAVNAAKMPTRDQVAKLAHEIWVKNGCRHGQDEQNWLEAERQLKAQMSR